MAALNPGHLRLLAVAALAALAGAAAGLFYASRAAGPPAAPQPAPVAALPLVLPAAPLPPATSAARPSTPPAPRPAATIAAPRLGSEGYGPHIERAFVGHDAAEAWEAVRWLRLCASNEARRNSFETVRNQGVSPEMMTQLMAETDAEARHCQTVTAQHRAMLPELASRAMRAGVPEAASAFAGEVFAGDLTPAQRQEVADAMRRDARSGDGPSLLGALVANEAWGLGDAEKLAYLAAYASLPSQQAHNQAVVKTLLEQRQIRFRSPPTAEQQAAARLAGQQIVDAAGGPP